MYNDPGAWDALLDRLARAVVRYLNAQIAAGVQAVQLFDSWAGCLGEDDYRRCVLPHTRLVIERHHSRRAANPLRHRQPGPAAGCWRGRAATSSASTGGSAWTTPGGGSARTGRSRETSIRPCSWPRPPKSAAAPRKILARPAGGPATSSTSATACFPKRPWKTCWRWSRPCTPAKRPAADRATGGKRQHGCLGLRAVGRDFPPPRQWPS